MSVSRCRHCDLFGDYTHDCIFALRAALAHERDRARRVVRVFWLVRYSDGTTSVSELPWPSVAWRLVREKGGKVYRVVVRRVAKKARTVRGLAG